MDKESPEFEGLYKGQPDKGNTTKALEAVTATRVIGPSGDCDVDRGISV